jgi:hypothetical protein
MLRRLPSSAAALRCCSCISSPARSGLEPGFSVSLCRVHLGLRSSASDELTLVIPVDSSRLSRWLILCNEEDRGLLDGCDSASCSWASVTLAAGTAAMGLPWTTPTPCNLPWLGCTSGGQTRTDCAVALPRPDRVTRVPAATACSTSFKAQSRVSCEWPLLFTNRHHELSWLRFRCLVDVVATNRACVGSRRSARADFLRCLSWM